MFIPPRLLAINITDIVTSANWASSDPDDPWVGFAYQWHITFTINSQSHSSPSTQSPYTYDGTNISVGDWISDVVSGSSLQIIGFVSRNYQTVTAIVEDIDRYNTFIDPTGQGNGACSPGTGFVFQLGDDGLPILTPMSSVCNLLGANLAWQLDQISRFRYRNLLYSYYRVDQASHGFSIGETIYLKPNGQYAAVDPTTATMVASVGSVSSVGIPGPDWFAYRPAGRVVKNLSPTLPGVSGELIYLTPVRAIQRRPQPLGHAALYPA